MYHHRHVKRFHVEGVIHADNAIPRFKTEYTRMLGQSMRERGYVMRIDIAPDFTIEYNGKSYEFQLSVYGTYVGRKKAQCIEYLDGSKPLMMKDTLPKSLIPQE
jgi:5-keto 4-deoxyuronate isomerase